VSTFISVANYDRLCKRALRDGRSLSDVVRARLLRGLRAAARTTPPDDDR
jgi:hypothetical protein